VVNLQFGNLAIFFETKVTTNPIFKRAQVLNEAQVTYCITKHHWVTYMNCTTEKVRVDDYIFSIAINKAINYFSILY